jgi:triacylglycerol lipase
VHGLLGFDRLTIAGFTMANYWPGILDKLQQAGNRVLVPFLSPTGGVAARAGQLKAFILEQAPREPVHIIGHSLGGLDARYMISHLGMAEHTLTLTTLGAPHRGTAFADWGVSRLERLVKPMLLLLGMPTEGFYDVTTAKCRAFNQATPDAPGVRYFSVAARHDGSYLNPEWLLPYHIVHRAEGDNDGVVSIASATWGEDLDVWEGDHLSLVNWFNPFGKNRGFFRDPMPRFGRILSKLADLGY